MENDAPFHREIAACLRKNRIFKALAFNRANSGNLLRAQLNNFGGTS